MLTRTGITSNKSLFSKASREFLEELKLDDINYRIYDAQLALIDAVTEQITALDHRGETELKE